eukprot:2927563-Prymnesium_polylepis.1
MPEFERALSAHLGRPTEHGRAEAERVGHLSLDFHGFWLESSGAKRGTWSHVLSHRARAGAPSRARGPGLPVCLGQEFREIVGKICGAPEG